MLDECIEHLESKAKGSKFTYEIIVVSDGSTDKTVQVAQQYAKKISSEKLRVLRLETNRGKGGAVRLVSCVIIFHRLHLRCCCLSTGDEQRSRICFAVC